MFEGHGACALGCRLRVKGAGFRAEGRVVGVKGGLKSAIEFPGKCSAAVACGKHSFLEFGEVYVDPLIPTLNPKS